MQIRKRIPPPGQVKNKYNTSPRQFHPEFPGGTGYHLAKKGFNFGGKLNKEIKYLTTK